MRILFSRVIAGVMILAALYVLLFGSKPGSYEYPDATAVPKDFTVVTYWEKWTREEGAGMQRVVDLFNTTEGRDKKIFVQLVSVSQVDQKTLVATAGGDPPDIAGLWGQQLGAFITYGALRPLTELQADGTITAETYKPFLWKCVAPHGTVYAASSTPATVAIFWNKDLFREAGLDPERGPQSIKELDEMADRLTVVDGKGQIIRAGYLPNFPGWWDYRWGEFFGNKIWNEETDDFRIDTPENVRAYSWYQKYAIKYGPGTVQTFGAGFGQVATPQNPFMNGTVAMCLQGPWFVSYVENYTPRFAKLNFSYIQRQLSRREITQAQADAKIIEARELFAEHYGAAMPPNSIGKPGDALHGDLDIWAIPRGAKHVKEALEVIRFFTRQENMELLCTWHSKPSPLMKVSEKFIRNHPNPYIDVFEEMLRSPNITGLPQSPNWIRAQDQIRLAANALWRSPERNAVEPTLRQAQENFDRHLAEYRKYAGMRKQVESASSGSEGRR